MNFLLWKVFSIKSSWLYYSSFHFPLSIAVTGFYVIDKLRVNYVIWSINPWLHCMLWKIWWCYDLCRVQDRRSFCCFWQLTPTIWSWTAIFLNTIRLGRQLSYIFSAAVLVLLSQRYMQFARSSQFQRLFRYDISFITQTSTPRGVLLNFKQLLRLLLHLSL